MSKLEEREVPAPCPEEARRALAKALVRWRQTRDPGLGDRVASLGEQTASLPAPKGAKSEAFHACWLQNAASADPGELSPLLAVFTKKLPSDPASAYLDADFEKLRYRGLFERLSALERFQPDPRIGRRLADLLLEAPYPAVDERTAATIYGPILAPLPKHADPRVIERLERIEECRAKSTVVRGWLEEVVPLKVQELREVVARAEPLPQAEREDCAKALAGPRRAQDQGDARGAQLLAEVLAAPDEDGPRQVWADWLSERGDPRGEFIALQYHLLRAPGDSQAEQRAMSLQRKHAKAWLGELSRVLTGCVFERGMLAKAELAHLGAAQDGVWERCAKEPLLATVHTLRQGRANEELYQAFVLNPAAVSLRDIDVPSNEVLRALVASSKQWRFERLVLAAPPTGEVAQALSGSPRFPALRSLEIHLARSRIKSCVKAVRGLALLTRLQQLGFRLSRAGGNDFDGEGVAELLAQLSALRPVPRVEIRGFYCSAAAIAVGRGWALEVSDAGPRALATLLAALPEVASLKATGGFVDSPEGFQQLKAMIAGRKIATVELPAYWR